MTACPSCRKPGRHVAVRIPWTAAGRVQVEHVCETYGCKGRLVPWLEDAVDELAVLAKVLPRRQGVNVTVRDCQACTVAAGAQPRDDVVVLGHSLACPQGQAGPELEGDCV